MKFNQGNSVAVFHFKKVSGKCYFSISELEKRMAYKRLSRKDYWKKEWLVND